MEDVKEDLPPVGHLLRDWRYFRKYSQLDLALRADTSTRHLSCVETGRAQPSREMVLRLAEYLDIPLRDRNTLLLAAGYAPAYRESPLQSERMAVARSALRTILEANTFHPAAAINAVWDVVDHNRAMSVLLSMLPPHLTGSGTNVMRLILHPDGLAQQCLNYAEVRAHALGRLLHQVHATGHRGLRSLYEEVCAYPTPPGTAPPPEPTAPGAIAIALRLRTPLGNMALSSMIATFGAPADVTLSELAVETFFPMDDDTTRILGELISDAEARSVIGT